MARLQYQALRKCTGAIMGSNKEKVNKIAGVEPVKMIMDQAQARFVIRSMRNPAGTGDLWPGDIKIENQEDERNDEGGREWDDHGDTWRL